MATEKLYRVVCDKSQFCGTVGQTTDSSSKTRNVANANGIRRVRVARIRFLGAYSGPGQPKNIYRDLCQSHMRRLDAIRAEVIAQWTGDGSYETVD